MTRGRRCAPPTCHVDDGMSRPFNWRRDTICFTMYICTMQKSNYRDNCICRGWESHRGVTFNSINCNFSTDVEMQYKSLISIIINNNMQQRLHWNSWVQVHKNQPMFRRHLRMTHDSFVCLLDKIRPQLPNMNETKGESRGGFIIPELCSRAPTLRGDSVSYWWFLFGHLLFCFVVFPRQHSTHVCGKSSMP